MRKIMPLVKPSAYGTTTEQPLVGVGVARGSGPTVWDVSGESLLPKGCAVIIFHFPYLPQLLPIKNTI